MVCADVIELEDCTFENPCLMSDLNCNQAYAVKLNQRGTDTPPLLNFAVAPVDSHWSCPGDCIGALTQAGENDPWQGGTIFAAESLGTSCLCAYQISEEQTVVTNSQGRITIVPC